MFEKLTKLLNDLNPKQLLILAGVVMFMMFAIMFFFLSWWTNEHEAEQIQNQPEPIVNMKTVVTAKVDIPPLTTIKKEMLETKEVPENLAPSDAITNISEVVDSSVKTAIFKDDVITERKLFSDLNQLTFVGTIPPDCRAISINVNEVTGVDGFAKPGDRVDLLLVETDENKSATTNILLQDVLLLSINKSMSKNNEATQKEGEVTTAAIENPSIATFALRPDEILKLISASKLGEIYLMLRPLHPTEQYYDNRDYTIDSISSQNKQKQQKPAAVTPTLPPIPDVTTLPPIPGTSPNVEGMNDENKFEIIQGDKIVQTK